MKVLMLSSDPRAFEPGSGAWERMQKYRGALQALEIVRLDRSRGRFSRFWKGYREAYARLRGNEYDIITTQDIEHAWLAWFLRRKFQVPFEMQIHTDIYSPFFWRGSLFNKLRVLSATFLIPRASCIRVVSRRVEHSLREKFSRYDLNISVLPIFPQSIDYGANIPSRPKVMDNRDFIILAVGRLAKEKNFTLALDVFAEFLKKSPDALLLLIGEGPEEYALKKKCVELGISPHVEFQKRYLQNEYQYADVLLVTSNYEGYSLVALEALHYGLPVVMTDVGVAGEVVKNGENGFVAPVGSGGGLLAALKALRSDPYLQKRMRERALAVPLPYGSFEEYRDKLLASWRTCGHKSANQ